jgi:hypothetical protein
MHEISGAQHSNYPWNALPCDTFPRCLLDFRLDGGGEACFFVVSSGGLDDGLRPDKILALYRYRYEFRGTPMTYPCCDIAGLFRVPRRLVEAVLAT